jgi:hypothetical protein
MVACMCVDLSVCMCLISKFPEIYIHTCICTHMLACLPICIFLPWWLTCARQQFFLRSKDTPRKSLVRFRIRSSRRSACSAWKARRAAWFQLRGQPPQLTWRSGLGLFDGMQGYKCARIDVNIDWYRFYFFRNIHRQRGYSTYFPASSKLRVGSTINLRAAAS